MWSSQEEEDVDLNDLKVKFHSLVKNTITDFSSLKRASHVPLASIRQQSQSQHLHKQPFSTANQREHGFSCGCSYERIVSLGQSRELKKNFFSLLQSDVKTLRTLLLDALYLCIFAIATFLGGQTLSDAPVVFFTCRAA